MSAHGRIIPAAGYQGVPADVGDHAPGVGFDTSEQGESLIPRGRPGSCARRSASIAEFPGDVEQVPVMVYI